jgi:hypothetical protein
MDYTWFSGAFIVIRTDELFKFMLFIVGSLESSEQNEDLFPAGGTVDAFAFVGLDIVGDAFSLIEGLIPQKLWLQVATTSLLIL